MMDHVNVDDGDGDCMHVMKQLLLLLMMLLLLMLHNDDRYVMIGLHRSLQYINTKTVD